MEIEERMRARESEINNYKSSMNEVSIVLFIISVTLWMRHRHTLR